MRDLYLNVIIFITLVLSLINQKQGVGYSVLISDCCYKIWTTKQQKSSCEQLHAEKCSQISTFGAVPCLYADKKLQVEKKRKGKKNYISPFLCLRDVGVWRTTQASLRSRSHRGRAEAEGTAPRCWNWSETRQRSAFLQSKINPKINPNSA